MPLWRHADHFRIAALPGMCTAIRFARKGRAAHYRSLNPCVGNRVMALYIYISLDSLWGGINCTITCPCPSSKLVISSYSLVFFSSDEWHCVSVMGSSFFFSLRKRTLVEVDQDLEKSPYRQNDLLLLREPDFSQQELTRKLWRCHQDKKVSGYLRIIWFLLDISGHIILAYSGHFWPTW